MAERVPIADLLIKVTVQPAEALKGLKSIDDALKSTRTLARQVVAQIKEVQTTMAQIQEIGKQMKQGPEELKKKTEEAVAPGKEMTEEMKKNAAEIEKQQKLAGDLQKPFQTVGDVLKVWPRELEPLVKFMGELQIPPPLMATLARKFPSHVRKIRDNFAALGGQLEYFKGPAMEFGKLVGGWSDYFAMGRADVENILKLSGLTADAFKLVRDEADRMQPGLGAVVDEMKKAGAHVVPLIAGATKATDQFQLLPEIITKAQEQMRQQAAAAKATAKAARPAVDTTLALEKALLRAIRGQIELAETGLEVSRRESMYLRWIGRDIMRIGFLLTLIGGWFTKQFMVAAKASMYLEGVLEDFQFAFEDIFSVVGDAIAEFLEMFYPAIEAFADFMEAAPSGAIIGAVVAGFVLIGGAVATVISAIMTLNGVLMILKFGMVDVAQRQGWLTTQTQSFTRQLAEMIKGALTFRFLRENVDKAEKSFLRFRDSVLTLSNNMSRAQAVTNTLRAAQEAWSSELTKSYKILETVAGRMSYNTQTVQKLLESFKVQDVARFLEAFYKTTGALKSQGVEVSVLNRLYVDFMKGLLMSRDELEKTTVFSDDFKKGLLSIKDASLPAVRGIFQLSEASRQAGMSEAQVAVLMQGMTKNIQSGNKAVKDRTSGLKRMGTTMVSAGSTMAGMFIWGAALNDLFQEMEPIITAFADAFMLIWEYLEPYIDILADLIDRFPGLGLAIGGVMIVAKLFPGVLSTIAAKLGITGAATTAWAAITAAASKLVTLSFMGIPIIGWIAGIIAALTLLYFAWQNNWFGIRDILGPVFASIQENINGFVTWVEESWNNMVTGISQAAGWLWGRIEEWFGLIGQLLFGQIDPLTFLKRAWDFLGNSIASIIGWVWDNILRPFFGWFGMEIGDSSTVITAFKDLWENTWNIIGGALEWVWENIIAPFFRFFGIEVGTFQETVEAMKEAWLAAWKPIGDFLKGIWDRILKPVLDRISGAIDAVKRALGGLGSAISKVKGAFKGLENVGASISKGIGDFAKQLGFSPGLGAVALETSKVFNALRAEMNRMPRVIPVTLRTEGIPAMGEMPVGGLGALMPPALGAPAGVSRTYAPTVIHLYVTVSVPFTVREEADWDRVGDRVSTIIADKLAGM